MTLRGGFDLVLMQAGWWACVLGAARGRFLIGPVVVALAAAAQLATAPAARRRLGVGLVALIVGASADSLQQGFGLLGFAGATARWLCPLWICALWFHFGTAVRPAMSALRQRPLWAAALGLMAGPLAYAGGARLGAAELHPRIWPSVISVALVWGVAVPLLVRGAWAEPEERS